MDADARGEARHLRVGLAGTTFADDKTLKDVAVVKAGPDLPRFRGTPDDHEKIEEPDRYQARSKYASRDLDRDHGEHRGGCIRCRQLASGGASLRPTVRGRRRRAVRRGAAAALVGDHYARAVFYGGCDDRERS